MLDDGIFLPKTYDFGPGLYHYMATEDQSSVEDSIEEIVNNHLSRIQQKDDSESGGIKTNKKYRD